MESTKNSTLDFKQFHRPWYLRLLYAVGGYFKNVGLMLWGVIKAIPKKLLALLFAIENCLKGLWFRFVKGDWRTKGSYLIMGFGCFTRSPKQIVKGLLLLALQVLFILFMVFWGAPNLAMFGTLGTRERMENPNGFGNIEGDNSIVILIFSMLSIMFMIFILYMWIKNTKISYENQIRVKEGKPLTGLKEQLSYALNDGYHTTVLALPILGILLITILPLICNILIAFTNFDANHSPSDGHIFTWTGFSAFGTVFGNTYSGDLWRVLGWTLVWAVFATFSNFFLGMFLAMMINKKSIKIKPLWRTCFVIVIAVPDFVTLLMMSKFFSYSNVVNNTGPFNKILIEWFGLGESANIDWFGATYKDSQHVLLARVMVIVINLWRGMPYTMLATSGILMNIPAELYESSRIDGAGPVRRFISITFPYIMFVMGPQLITTFTGNINNFNVIFFLTGGGPMLVGNSVGSTSLLITWLYDMTVASGKQQYNLGAVLGLFMFLVTSFFALIVFNSSKSVSQEDTFK